MKGIISVIQSSDVISLLSLRLEPSFLVSFFVAKIFQMSDGIIYNNYLINLLPTFALSAVFLRTYGMQSPKIMV